MTATFELTPTGSTDGAPAPGPRWAMMPAEPAAASRRRAPAISRRSVLAGGVGLAALAGGGLAVSRLLGRSSTSAAALLQALRPAPSDRTLIVLELAGGNDGMSTLVPYADGMYRQLRRRTAIDEKSVLRIDDHVGLHPELRRLHQRGLAVVQGVGVAHPDLSHFEMLRRWWLGDPDGRSDLKTGFLGRVCDAVGDPTAPAVGISLGSGPSPALGAERVTTVGLDGLSEHLGAGDELATTWRAALRAMAQPDRADAAPVLAARRGDADALRLMEVIENLPARGPGYPDTDLGLQLSLAARLVAARSGVRIVHVPVSADFDTHEGHLARCAANMRLIDEAVDALQGDLDERQLSASTLILIWSEFGRRAADNGSDGLDHGTASVALLAGAARPGLYGAQPRLDRLDEDGDPSATVGMDELYATVAEAWFGVPAGDVLPSGARPLAGIV